MLFPLLVGASHKQSTSENTYIWYIYKIPIHIYQIMPVFKEAAAGQGLNWQQNKQTKKNTWKISLKNCRTLMLWDFFVHFFAQWEKKKTKKYHWCKWEIWKTGNWVVEAATATTTKSFCCRQSFTSKRGFFWKQDFYCIFFFFCHLPSVSRAYLAVCRISTCLRRPNGLWRALFQQAAESAEGSPRAPWPHADNSSAICKNLHSPARAERMRVR